MAPAARFEGRVLLAVRDRSDFGSQFCKRSVVNGPGPFFLREPALKEVRFKRSGTVLAPGVSFQGVCFYGLGTVLAP